MANARRRSAADTGADEDDGGDSAKDENEEYVREQQPRRIIDLTRKFLALVGVFLGEAGAEEGGGVAIPVLSSSSDG